MPNLGCKCPKSLIRPGLVAEVGLDDLGAPYYLVRWVAGPARIDKLETRARFDAARQALLSDRMTGARFAQLVKQFPPLRPPQRKNRR